MTETVHTTTTVPLPLVYSCSGGSSAAQLANDVAVRLDRRGLAEMSCIAGVGGHVPKLVQLARSGRPIIAVDGCPMECVAGCLAQHDIVAERHYRLHEHGVKKLMHQDFDPEQSARIFALVDTDLQAQPLSRHCPRG